MHSDFFILNNGIIMLSRKWIKRISLKISEKYTYLRVFVFHFFSIFSLRSEANGGKSL